MGGAGGIVRADGGIVEYPTLDVGGAGMTRVEGGGKVKLRVDEGPANAWFCSMTRLASIRVVSSISK